MARLECRMATQVRNSGEFKRLIEALVLELVDSNIAFNMHTRDVVADVAIAEAHQHMRDEVGELLERLRRER
jgi:hypothetical protein